MNHFFYYFFMVYSPASSDSATSVGLSIRLSVRQAMCWCLDMSVLMHTSDPLKIWSWAYRPMTKPLLSEWSFDCAYLKNKPGLSCTVRPSGNVLMVRHVFAHALSDPLKIWSWAYRPMTKPLLYDWTWRRSLNCPVLKNKLGLSCTQNFLKSSKKWEKRVRNTKFLENWLQTRLQTRLQMK